MRDYQTKANQGALPDSNTATKYGAGEVNSLREESKNAVSRTGLTLAPQDGTGDDTTQLAQSLFINGIAASSFQAAGLANAITLTPVTGSAGLLLPPDYDTLDGMRIDFIAATDNTGATTFSIGQTGGTQFGTKKILLPDGSALSGGEILQDTITSLIYDATLDGAVGAARLVTAAGAAPGSVPIFNAQDQRTSGTDAGSSTSGSFETRTLNTVIINEIGASLASDEITLVAGTYDIEASSPSDSAGRHKLVFFNITDVTEEIIGTSEYADVGGNGNTRSKVSARITIAATKVFDLRQRVETSSGGAGQGRASSFGVIEIYAEITIRKIS